MEQIDNKPVLVSIKCLVYNHEPYLRKCLNGFVMQKTNFRFEAIVHDDCSTDGSAAIIREYAEKYPNIIKPIYEVQNCYSTDWSVAEAKIAKMYKGKYLAFCEGDDYWIDENKLQKEIDCFLQNDNLSVVYSDFILVDYKGNQISRVDYDRIKRKSVSSDIFASLLCKGNFIMTCTACYKMSVLFDDLYNNAPKLDYAFSLTASVLGDSLFISSPTAAYRKNPKSLTNSQNSFVGKRQIEIRTYFFTKYLTRQIAKRNFIDDLRIKLSAIQHAQRNGLLGQFVMYNKCLIILYPLSAVFYLCKRIKILLMK